MKTNHKYVLLSVVTALALVGGSIAAMSSAQAVTALSCAPSVQSVMLGQSASFTASGGNGSYVWSSPDLTISNPTGSGFTANYASIGVKTMTVSSAGASATCTVDVLPVGTVPATPSTPGLPNTGGGYGQQ